MEQPQPLIQQYQEAPRRPVAARRPRGSCWASLCGQPCWRCIHAIVVLADAELAEELHPSPCGGLHGHGRIPGRYAHICCFCADPSMGLGVRGYPVRLEYAWFDPPLGGGEPEAW